MQEVKHKLAILTRIWQHYVLDYKFMQGGTRFDEDVRTNYFGDILAYFNDTLELLSSKKSESFGSSIFNTVGILQIMYVHQDLIDELLYIFRLDETTRDAKDPIRRIRNQLVGHPISRGENGMFVSSAFFGNDHDGETIHYILYARDNRFSGEDYHYNLNDLIILHNAFLVKYLDTLLSRGFTLLTGFKNRLIDLQRIISAGKSAEIILKVADFHYETIFKESYIFTQTFLPVYYARREEHARYYHAWESFLHNLAKYLVWKKEDIAEIIKEGSRPYQPPEPFEPVTIIFDEPVVIDPGKQVIAPEGNDDNDYHYILSKLMQRHPVFGIEYFRERFATEPEIMEELKNMEDNYHDDLEYYASYEYIRYLLGENDNV